MPRGAGAAPAAAGLLDTQQGSGRWLQFPGAPVSLGLQLTDGSFSCIVYPVVRRERFGARAIHILYIFIIKWGAKELRNHPIVVVSSWDSMMANDACN